MSRKIQIILLLTIFTFTMIFTVGCQDQTTDENMPETIKIGFVGPLSGANASEGLPAKDAFQMLFDEANKKNILPYDIEVVAYDDASIPEIGVEAVNKLINDEQVVAASAHWNSPVAESTIPVFISAKCPMVIWGAISDSLTCEDNYPYITRVVPTDNQENQPLAGYVLGDLGYKNIFIITDTTSYGQSNTVAFQNQMASYSAQLTGFAQTEPGTTDFKAILNKAKNSGCDAIFYGGTAQEGGIIASQMNEMGINDILLFGISGITSEEFIKTAGTKAAEGTIATSPGIDPENSPEYKNFLEKYQNYSENNIGTFTVYAYHAAQVILAALQDIEGVPNRQNLTEAIANVDMEGVLGRTTFDAIGQTTNPMCYLVVCQDGKWVPYDTSEYATGIRTLPGIQ
jgi:branched-chain amino acid transport system substrate-binding protein